MLQTKILLGLFFCHWLADYTHLSTGWMLNAKQTGKQFLPILIHAGIHASLMTLYLVLIEAAPGKLPELFLFQLFTHFIIDVWKGRMNGWFPQLKNTSDKFHWWIFGLDQYLHAVVIIIMSAYCVHYWQVFN